MQVEAGSGAGLRGGHERGCEAVLCGDVTDGVFVEGVGVACAHGVSVGPGHFDLAWGSFRFDGLDWCACFVQGVVQVVEERVQAGGRSSA
ncbi:hypothetical protein SAV31267_097760 [Streptomyces avermitilis]|uniref:Uncharacterized protein n=1 Tax=Streptomyces avermitilis TaxID=33903 RepID=A0A4D4N6T9_STRAX|nr:hypothetical protein SAV31267_097760 [Streptomyces avermitilis]